MNQTWLADSVEERPLLAGERIRMTLDLAFRHLSNNRRKVRLLPKDRKAMLEGLSTTWRQ